MTGPGWALTCQIPCDWTRIDTTDPTSWPDGPQAAQARAMCRTARRHGVVLWAGRDNSLAGTRQPMSPVFLTLSIRSRMTGSPVAPPYAAPFDFVDPRLRGFLTVGSYHQPLPGADRPVEVYKLDVYAIGEAAGLLAIVTVTTPDPACREDAAIAVVSTARSLRLRPGQSGNGTSRPAPGWRVA